MRRLKLTRNKWAKQYGGRRVSLVTLCLELERIVVIFGWDYFSSYFIFLFPFGSQLKRNRLLCKFINVAHKTELLKKLLTPYITKRRKAKRKMISGTSFH